MRRRALSLSAAFRELAVPPGGVGLCFLGQSGFLVRSRGGAVAVIDPYLSDRAGTDRAFGPLGRWARRFPPPIAPDELDADAVLITHEHADHLDPLTLGPFLAKHVVPVVGPAALGPQIEELGGRFLAARPGKPINHADLVVHPVPAAHAVSYTGPECYALDPERFCGFVVEAGDVAVFHAGDTVPHTDISARVAPLRPPVALLPINGRDAAREEMGIVGNLTIREAAQLAGAVGSRWIVPCHHDLFAVNGESQPAFVDVLDREFPSQEYLILKPGRPVVLVP